MHLDRLPLVLPWKHFSLHVKDDEVVVVWNKLMDDQADKLVKMTYFTSWPCSSSFYTTDPAQMKKSRI